MNSYAKVAIAAAAVLVVAVVGYKLLPGTGPGPGSVPTPCVSTPSASGAPDQAFPPTGELPSGSCQTARTLDGVRFAFRVPSAGWKGEVGSTLLKGTYPEPDGVEIDFWPSAPENVYADPCAHTPLDPPPSATASGLAAAVAAVPGLDVVSGPSSVTIGGRPAQKVVFTVREDLACAPHEAHLWYDESTGGAAGGWRWAEQLGATLTVWIIDVDGTLVFIDSYTFKGAGAGPGQAIQQVMGSIVFGS